ncbi:hypothetical protein JMN32_12225 [Fulvivirga sp. 29W222]|uniref:Uncharacterized protein n=1 Tax=Fulvivirga marina TaxID=2494733 RepID=A0A937KC77_9BACT|nr:hypothetical protein [Fulvivirga marina]MBL6447079.1 hypothetical protein [Fulvivirga marina]
MKKITHWYDTEFSIFYKYYYGDIEYKDLVSDWTQLINEGKIPQGVKKFILDYRKADLLAPPHMAIDIANFYKENIDCFLNARVALIMQKPDQVVLPILANQECQEVLKFKPFYTLEAAFNWVNELNFLTTNYS